MSTVRRLNPPRAFMLALGLTTCICACALAAPAANKPATRGAPSQKDAAIQCSGDSSAQIDSTMYFMSKPQDAAQCAMHVAEGRIVFDPAVTNPAMTCPDLFSWSLFARVVSQQFWKGWAADQQTWSGVNCPNGDAQCKPSSPLPLCRPGSPAGSCCDPNSQDNPGYGDGDSYPAKYCPYFPGDHVAQDTVPVLLRQAQPPSKAHLVSFAASPQVHQKLLTDMKLARSEPGRKIRQAMAELVFRNKPMFDFVFRNNLYNQNGIISVFNQNQSNIYNPANSPVDKPDYQLNAGMPYRIANGPQALTEIDFPVESIMIKSNWVAKERAAELELFEDPDAPYIKMTLSSPVTDNNGTILLPGEHWLVAFHISSKDTPNWVWSTFEHVNNPGRCDYTGCNDAFGYPSLDPVKPGQATNYTRPKMKCDELNLPTKIFDTGKRYPTSVISTGLDAVLAGLHVGDSLRPTRCDVKGPDGKPICMPDRGDSGWKSYRLKGTQVNFTDSMGRATRLGNSVTEGGFVNTSSCISCHARAGTQKSGTVAPLALGVFVNEVSEAGYGQSHFGIPVADWYHHSRQPPTLDVLQTDFVWGFLSANPLQPTPPVNAQDSLFVKPAGPPLPNTVQQRRNLMPGEGP